jgi:peroxiredoxin
MKRFLYMIIFMAFFVSCKEKPTGNYLIDGKIKNLNDSTLYIITQRNTSEFLHVDTVFCSKEGKFTYEGFSDSLSTVVIYMEKGMVWTTIWVKDKDKITITGDVKYPELILAKGNEVNNLLARFKEENEDLLKDSRDLTDRKTNVDLDTLSVEINNTQYESKLSNINHQLKEKAEDFIEEHPTSVASLVLIQDYLIDSDDSNKLQEYLSMIHGDAVNDPLYEKLALLDERIQSTAIGSVAPDFSLIDIKKDTISLEKYKGKYLLLSFAAAWCEPCGEESNEYVTIRKKFRKDKLGMVTISIDENQSEWKDFTTKNNYSWEQVIDTRGWDSPMVSLYNVTFIPSNFLLDKDNVIIAKNLPIDSLIVLLNNVVK